MTLTEFLLARIAEDEANCGRYIAVFPEGDMAPLFSRVLAECEAKRRIITDFQLLSEPGGLVDQLMLPSLREVLVTPLRHLASVYADHPDYREKWKP